MPATLFPERASRERSVSVLSDRSYQSQTATESKLDAYARYYGINFNSASRNSMESDYSNEYSSSKKLTRISEVEDRRTTDREFSVARSEYDYSKALVAANAVDSRARSQTPFLDLTRTRERPASYAAEYSATGKSDTEALHDVLSYTRNVLSLMGTDGNVKVNLSYRPQPPVYNYTPTHKHYHVFSPNNYYVTQPAPPAQPAYVPPAPIYQHHHHYPTRSVTVTTTKRYCMPYQTAMREVNSTKSIGETSVEYGLSSSTQAALESRRSNRAVSEFRDTSASSATEALNYGRSARAQSEFRDSGAADYGYGDYGYGGDLGFRAKSRSRARSEFADAAGDVKLYEYDSTNRRAKLEAALEEDEENYRRRTQERGASMRPY